MDFGALPPEINSARMYAGPGPASLAGAAAAWDNLAAELQSAAASYRSVIAGLTVGRWLGPASLAMASAFGPYVAWTAGAAARAEEAAGQARLAVEIYEAAFAMTVPPEAVIANRVQLASLVATNFLGQNSPAIAATEAQYAQMWAQDAVAMYEYAANSAEASDLTVFTPAPQVTDSAGAASQAAAVANAADVAGTVQSTLTSLVSSVPATLQALASPASIASNLQTTLSSFQSQLPYALPSYFMAAATPLYGMSSVLGIAQTAQSLGNAAASGAVAAAQGAASAAGSAASSAAGALGSGVLGSIGTASSLGPMSVPASWTSVIPSAQLTAATLPNAAGLGGQPNLLGGLPLGRSAVPRTPPAPRYGIVPTAMARPPAAG
jgi:PPE-repeat protein